MTFSIPINPWTILVAVLIFATIVLCAYFFIKRFQKNISLIISTTLLSGVIVLIVINLLNFEENAKGISKDVLFLYNFFHDLIIGVVSASFMGLAYELTIKKLEHKDITILLQNNSNLLLGFVDTTLKANNEEVINKIPTIIPSHLKIFNSLPQTQRACYLNEVINMYLHDERIAKYITKTIVDVGSETERIASNVEYTIHLSDYKNDSDLISMSQDVTYSQPIHISGGKAVKHYYFLGEEESGMKFLLDNKANTKNYWLIHKELFQTIKSNNTTWDDLEYRDVNVLDGDDIFEDKNFYRDTELEKDYPHCKIWCHDIKFKKEGELKLKYKYSIQSFIHLRRPYFFIRPKSTLSEMKILVYCTSSRIKKVESIPFLHYITNDNFSYQNFEENRSKTSVDYPDLMLPGQGFYFTVEL